MKIKQCKNQLEMTHKRTIPINVFYSEDNKYKYNLSIVENENIIKVTKEDTESEWFEVTYFEITDKNFENFE